MATKTNTPRESTAISIIFLSHQEVDDNDIGCTYRVVSSHVRVEELLELLS
jgi:hypothetical protein